MDIPEKKQYDAFAQKYATIDELPHSKLEAQLIRLALGDCTGLTVLDLGGGSGLHARSAIEADASSVDVFDISPEMMRIGQEIETKLSRQDRIRWFEADATRPLAEQVENDSLRPEGYDIVMANWVLDHATSMADLEAMWENITTYLRPGGRFLGVRVQNVRAEYMSYGKYGVTFTELEEIPGGLKYIVGCLTQPPLSFGATSMHSTLMLTDDIPRGLGLVDFQVVPPEETDVIKGGRVFWDEYLKDPYFNVVVARKQ